MTRRTTTLIGVIALALVTALPAVGEEGEAGISTGWLCGGVGEAVEVEMEFFPDALPEPPAYCPVEYVDVPIEPELATYVEGEVEEEIEVEVEIESTPAEPFFDQALSNRFGARAKGGNHSCEYKPWKCDTTTTTQATTTTTKPEDTTTTTQATTTTSQQTTTTTLPTTTTSIGDSSTTTGDTTTTTVQISSTSVTTPTTDPSTPTSTLPFTGPLDDVNLLTFSGAGIMVLGWVALMEARRMRKQEDGG